jgi:hypothetical protein
MFTSLVDLWNTTCLQRGVQFSGHTIHANVVSGRRRQMAGHNVITSVSPPIFRCFFPIYQSIMNASVCPNTSLPDVHVASTVATPLTSVVFLHVTPDEVAASVELINIMRIEKRLRCLNEESKVKLQRMIAPSISR